MDYFSRKPDFPTFEDIYIACAQGAIGLERREDGLACRFGQDGPAIMLPQVASRGDGVRGRAVCDGIAGALKEDRGSELPRPDAWTRTSPRLRGAHPSARRAGAIAFSHAMSI